MVYRLIFILLAFSLQLCCAVSCALKITPRYKNSFGNDDVIKYHSFDSFSNDIHKRFFICCATSDYRIKIDSLSKRIDSSVSMFDLTDNFHKVDCKKGLPSVFLKDRHLYHLSTSYQSKYNGFFMTYVSDQFYVFNMTDFGRDNSKKVIGVLIKQFKKHNIYTRKIERKIKKYMKYRCFYGWMG